MLKDLILAFFQAFIVGILQAWKSRKKTEAINAENKDNAIGDDDALKRLRDKFTRK